MTFPIRLPLAWALVALWGLLLGAPPVGAAVINGIEYRPLSTVAGALGMETRWLTPGERLRVESSWTKMDFVADKREFTLNGVVVHLLWPVSAKGGKLWISLQDFQRTLQPILTPNAFQKPPKLGLIVLDAGHGGKDTGALNPKLKLTEKAMTMDLTRRVATLLKARGYRVVLTRNDDRFIALPERAAIANRAQADLFVSLHFNAAEGKANGAETFALTPSGAPSSGRSKLAGGDKVTHPGNRFDPWNTLAAYHVQRALVETLKVRDRGLKRARWAVLRDLEMPGILIEGGFLTDAEEAKQIGSAAYRQKIAQAIADGIYQYQLTLNRVRKAS